VKYRSVFPFKALFVVALSASGCGDEGTMGELRNGAFVYSCSTDRDALCSLDPGFGDAALKAMPSTVAVGAQFGVVFKAQTSAARDGSASVLPVSKDLLIVVDSSGPVFVAAKPGYAGLLAQRGSAVVDIFHVRLVEVDHIRITGEPSISGGSGISAIEIQAEGFAMLSAAPVDDKGDILAGSLDYQWTSDDSAVAEITSPPGTDQITLKGGAPGQTKVRVIGKGMSAEVTVTVTGSAGAGSGGGGGGGAGGAGGAGGGS
jgi:hypothetical protein